MAVIPSHWFQSAQVAPLQAGSKGWKHLLRQHAHVQQVSQLVYKINVKCAMFFQKVKQ